MRLTYAPNGEFSRRMFTLYLGRRSYFLAIVGDWRISAGCGDWGIRRYAKVEVTAVTSEEYSGRTWQELLSKIERGERDE